MKPIKQYELKEKLKLHKLWLLEMEGGKKLNLSDMNLNSLNLNNLNISYADLTESTLYYADLIGSDLIGATLKGAKLRKADLRGADLSNVDLRYADLTDADLRYADLTNAKLQCVNHQGVKGQTVISIQFDTSRENNQLSYWKDLGVWTTGCFQGSLEELLERINETHEDNVELKDTYVSSINYILKLAERKK